VDAAGTSLGEVLSALDARFPGIRFRIIDEQDRIRPHIRIFLDGPLAARLSEPVAGVDRVQIICALSGG
jgi:hypothetical protein